MRAEDMQIRRGASEVLRVPWRDVTFFAATLAADVSGPRPSRFRLGGLPLARVYIVFPVDTSTCRGGMSCSFSPSDRLAASSPEVSHFDILPVPAHTAIVKACLGILLQSDNDAGRANAISSYLANYAARHWVDHARFEKVSTQIEGGM